jgi:prevent-host-death family protein
MINDPLKVSLENIIPLTEARDHFSQIVNEVQKDKLYVLTKGGKPAVAIIDVKYLETLTNGQIQKSSIEQEIKKAPEKVGLPPMIEHHAPQAVPTPPPPLQHTDIPSVEKTPPPPAKPMPEVKVPPAPPKPQMPNPSDNSKKENDGVIEMNTPHVEPITPNAPLKTPPLDPNAKDGTIDVISYDADQKNLGNNQSQNQTQKPQEQNKPAPAPTPQAGANPQAQNPGEPDDMMID